MYKKECFVRINFRTGSESSRGSLERVIEDFISKADFTKSVCNPLKDLILEWCCYLLLSAWETNKKYLSNILPDISGYKLDGPGSPSLNDLNWTRLLYCCTGQQSMTLSFRKSDKKLDQEIDWMDERHFLCLVFNFVANFIAIIIWESVSRSRKSALGGWKFCLKS